MKKITLIVAAVLFAASAFAQQPRFGIKGGLNMAQETVDDASTDTRAGIYLGLFMEARIGRMTDIQPEFYYSMQGGGGDKIDYIHLPLMFKFFTGAGRRFSIDVGPQVGYAVSAKDGNGNSFYDADAFNKFDVSLNTGVAWKLDGGFDVGLRLINGLSSIGDSPVGAYKNSVFQFGLAYSF